MQRRGFLGAILAAGMAPAYVGASVLMPVKQIIAPEICRPELVVFWNGLLLLPGHDYVESDGKVKLLTGAVRRGDVLDVSWATHNGVTGRTRWVSRT